MTTITNYNEAIATQLAVLIFEINNSAQDKVKYYNDKCWWAVLESYKEATEFSLTDLIALNHVSNYVYNNCSNSVERMANAFCHLIANAIKHDHKTEL